VAILRQREHFREALDNFDPAGVAQYDKARIEELSPNARIIRNRQKINSVIIRARAFLKVQGGVWRFDAYIWGFLEGRPIQNAWQAISALPAKIESSTAINKDLKKRGFSFVGLTNIQAFMRAMGMVSDHTMACFHHKVLSPTS